MSKLSIPEKLLSISSDDEFDAQARETFAHQLQHNAVFNEFVRGIKSKTWQESFIPIELFKSHRVSCHATEESIFKSSGTSSSQRSQHFVHDLSLYRKLSIGHFESLYGALNDLVILALLPSYQDQGDSSLVWMVDQFVQSSSRHSQFVGADFESLQRLIRDQVKSEKVLLLGVSYALLDFAENHSIDHPNLSIMETGGMKGRREEITREELHRRIRLSFPTSEISSEYGMTELLSQAYLMDGQFVAPPWVRVFATNVSDPLEILEPGRRGILAFADLANYHSCSFIQTQDIGGVDNSGRFTVEGRLDHSDIRGCNLLYT